MAAEIPQPNNKRARELLKLTIEDISNVRPQANLRDEDKVDLSHFDIIKTVASGGCGTVFQVRKKGGHDDGTLYAMKVVRKTKVLISVHQARQMKSEREVLEAIGGKPFLVKMHYAFQTESKLFIVLDYVGGGELFEHLNNRHNDHFTENEVRLYIAELVLAIQKLHEAGIVYRDIKLENILLDADGHIVVTDFGLAKDLTRQRNHRTYSFCGTIDYLAPEILRQNGDGYGFCVDWWSVGVLAYELLCGCSPFTKEGDDDEEMEEDERAARITQRILGTNPEMPATFSADVSDFIRLLLTKNPMERLGAGLKGVDDVKAHKFFDGIDWEKLAHKQIEPTYKPIIENPPETDDLVEDITNESEVRPYEKRCFRGFSFVAPEHQQQLPNGNTAAFNERPTVHEVIEHNSENGAFFKRYSFVENEPVGKGTFSVCMKCVDNDTDKEYAVKILRSTYDAEAEVEALNKCNGHENIVSFVEVIKDDAFTYIITEWLAGEELFEYIHKQEVDEFEVRKIFMQILKAVSHIHAQNFVHGDLKLENIKFASENASTVRLLDFGFATMLSTEEAANKTGRYTLDYAAPEVLWAAKYTEASDLWSIGVILYTLLCGGHLPFRRHNGYTNETSDLIAERIHQSSVDESGEWEWISEPAKDLIRRLLDVSPQSRITLNEIRAHEWLDPADDVSCGTNFNQQMDTVTSVIIDEGETSEPTIVVNLENEIESNTMHTGDDESFLNEASSDDTLSEAENDTDMDENFEESNNSHGFAPNDASILRSMNASINIRSYLASFKVKSEDGVGKTKLKRRRSIVLEKLTATKHDRIYFGYHETGASEFALTPIHLKRVRLRDVKSC